MEIDKELISKLEVLAKLRLADEEKDQLMADLNEILEMMNKVKEVDVAGFEPLRHLSVRHDVTRPDIPEEALSREVALSNAPDQDGSYFKVPNVLAGAKKRLEK